MKSDVVQELDYLINERGQDFDYVLVEASGIADPERLSQLFWVDSGLESSLYLDAIICVVEANNVENHLNSDGEGFLFLRERE